MAEDDKIEIREKSNNLKILMHSIYGHQFIKKELAFSLFGGVSKDIQDKYRIRDDINFLLLGDPGNAKSQFSKYNHEIFPKSIYITVNEALGIGLTEIVQKDPINHEWSLSGEVLLHQIKAFS